MLYNLGYASLYSIPVLCQKSPRSSFCVFGDWPFDERTSYFCHQSVAKCIGTVGTTPIPLDAINHLSRILIP